MPLFAITYAPTVTIEAESQAEAVLQFEQEHPGLGGSITRVEPLDREPVNGPDGYARDAETN